MGFNERMGRTFVVSVVEDCGKYCRCVAIEEELSIFFIKQSLMRGNGFVLN